MVSAHMAASLPFRKRLLLALLLMGFLLVWFSQPLQAAPYGSGSYDSSCYSNSCATSGSPAGSGNSAGAPNTGLERTSIIWAGVAGFIGFCALSFVAIRLINSSSVSKKG